jgi:hypothetical protein
MKIYGGVEVRFKALLKSALDIDESSTSHSGRFTPGKMAPDTLWIWG